MSEQRWTYTFTLTVPDDVEAGDAATEVVRVLDDYLVEDYPEWKVGDLELVIAPAETRAASGAVPLRSLVTSWRGYVKTPDNDYSDGMADGLSEAAGELEDWLNVNEQDAKGCE